MGRTPKGKPLTLRPVRLDDEVWAECQKLGKAHGTINEGLRVGLQLDAVKFTPEIEAKIQRNVRPREARPFRGQLLRPKERK